MEVAFTCRNQPPQELIDALYAQTMEFSQGQLSDDLSLLALRFL
jgi:serine phosphatase RsbU (regulator of sigma subunit)